MTERKLEVRHEDGTITICDLDLDARTVSEGRQSEPSAPPSPLDFALRRYDIEAVVGRGGFATVVRAYDRELGRTVALKIPRRDDDGLRSEGELAAGLQHPNIVPIYDAGESEDGSPYYAMKLLEGSSLSEILKQIEAGDAELRSKYTDARLLEAFRQVCLAVQYAHDQGVLHRDIKPANIIMGQYGEVVLADWGIAWRLDSDDDEGGLLRGTLAYIAPERLTEDVHGSIASDIFALGAVLFEILAFRPAYAGSRNEILDAIIDGPPPAPSRYRPDIPQRLESLCLQMLASRPSHRPESAGEVAEQVADVLDAQRAETARKRRAAQSFGRARQAFDAYQRATRRMEELYQRVRDYDGQVDPEARTSLWRLQADAEDSRVQREVMFGRAVTAFEHVLHDDDDHVMARAGLAELHLERLVEAEDAGDRVAAAGIEQMVHGAGFAPAIARLQAPAAVHIETSPTPATMKLYEFRPLGPVLELVDRVENHKTPIELTLKPGSYCARLSQPGFVEQWIPFVASRGSRLKLEVRVYRRERIPDGFEIVSGPDGDYAMGRHPVTVADFLEFANSIPVDVAHTLIDSDVGGMEHFFRRSDSDWVLPRQDADGDAWGLRWPMLLISRVVAEQYASWLGEKLNLPVRLPTVAEWEWAAAGPDGRRYPWGHGVDVGCANFRTNSNVRGTPLPVGSFPADRSPFGIYDFGGGVTEWTSSTDPESGAGFLKGASYNSHADTSQIRVSRTARPGEGYAHYGMRMCFSLANDEP